MELELLDCINSFHQGLIAFLELGMLQGSVKIEPLKEVPKEVGLSFWVVET